MDIGPHVVIDEAVAIGHLDRGERSGVERRSLRDDVVEIEDVARHGIDVVVAERLGIGERHRATNVVEERRRVRPVAPYRFNRPRARKRPAASRENRHTAVAFAEVAVTRGALVGEDLLAMRDRSASRRQPFSGQAVHVDVPPGDLRRRRRPAKTVLRCVGNRKRRYE